MVALRIAFAVIVLCALVLVPFLLWGDAIDHALAGWMQTTSGVWAIVALVVGLLSADVVLPLPSSLVAAWAGAQLGLFLGALAVFFGLTIGNLIGYWLGRRFGASAAQRMTGGEGRLPETIGVPILCLTRPVPVLSEPATVIAGAGRMPLGTFLAAVGLSNAGIALVYGAFGAWAQDTSSFLLVFAAAVAVPAAGFVIYFAGTGGLSRRATGAD